MNSNALRIKNCPKCREPLEEYHGYYYCKAHGHFESWKCKCGAKVYGFDLSDSHTLLCSNCTKTRRQIAFDKRLAKADDMLHIKFVNDVIDNPERAFREFKKQQAREKLRKLGYRI